MVWHGQWCVPIAQRQESQWRLQGLFERCGLHVRSHPRVWCKHPSPEERPCSEAPCPAYTAARATQMSEPAARSACTPGVQKLCLECISLTSTRRKCHRFQWPEFSSGLKHLGDLWMAVLWSTLHTQQASLAEVLTWAGPQEGRVQPLTLPRSDHNKAISYLRYMSTYVHRCSFHTWWCIFRNSPLVDVSMRSWFLHM